MKTENSVSQLYLALACRHLKEDFMPKIRKCVHNLSDEEVWWRPNDHSNSVGNMLLHLDGNVRQWIISGVGQTGDTRVRDLEFAEQGPIAKADLLERLESTVREAVEVLQSLGSEALLQKRHIQIYDTTVLEAVFHVVEHFSGHTGQIIYVTKMLRDQDCRFYDL
jgi:uncharacterized damage-inducible protein DinB